MFKRFGIALLTVFSMLAPNIAQATVVTRHAVYRPSGYYYHNGRWRPYRGFGHPYRGGYYDRWGHWHRYY